MLKTMGMRLRGATKTELEELGIDTEGMTDAKKSVVKQFKSMAGIDIMEGKEYKSTFQILDELHDKWESLSDAEHAALTEAIAGKRGGTVMASLMQNWEDARKVIEKAELATGTAENRHALMMESAAKKLEVLKANAQEFAYNVIDSDALKGGIDVLTELLKLLNNITKATDGLIPVVGSLGIAFYAFNSITGIFDKLSKGLGAVQKSFEAGLLAKKADVLLNGKEAASEYAVVAAKSMTETANKALTASQLTETEAEMLDSYNNIANAESEIVVAGSKSGTTATGLASVFGTLGVAGTALVGVLTAIAATAYLVHQRNEELKDSASELASGYGQSVQELDDYKERIVQLQATINDSSTSYEDAKVAREELLGIQNALIEKYGDEAEGIDLVTQAVNGQVDALDRLKQREWDKTVNEFNEEKGSGFIDGVNRWWRNLNNGKSKGQEGYITDNIGIMNDEMFNAKVKVRATDIDDKEFLEQMQEAIGGDFEVDMNVEMLSLTGDLDEVRDKLYQIQNAAKVSSVSETFMSGLNRQINEVEDTLTKYQDMADQWTFNEEVMPRFSDQFKNFQNIYKTYHDALIEGNTDIAQNAADSMVKVFENLRSSGASNRVLDYFRNMYPELKGEIGSWELAKDLENKTIDDLKAGFTDAVGKFSSLEKLKNAQNSADEETQKSYRLVEELANRYGMTVDALIAKIQKLGGLPIGFKVNQGAVTNFSKAMNRGGYTYNESESNALDQAISQSQYQSQINTFGEAYWDKIAQKIDEAHKANNGLELSQEQINAAVKEGTEEYIAEAEAVKKAAEGLDEDAFSLDGAAESIKKLKTISALYEKFANQKKEGKKNPIFDAEDLAGLDVAIKELDSFDDFVAKLTSGTASVDEIQQAFNRLATEFIYDTECLDGLDEQTKDFFVSQFELQGITNATELVMHALADGERIAADYGVKLADVTDRNAIVLLNEARVAGASKEELQALAGAMLNAALMKLDESFNIQQLYALADAAGVARSALDGLTHMSSAVKQAKNAGNAAAQAAAQAGVRAAGYNAASNIRRQKEASLNAIFSTPPGGGKTGGGGGGSKEAEKEKDILAELSKQLDEIQAAYSSLTEIVKSYNENGKLTIDQAQELINTDFRYLAMLTDEGGQLRLNEQGMQDLAKAKLQEMQIQLARNAIDTVNSLKTEADAVNFLTYAYEGLAGATLDATEAQLQLAVAAAKARGEQQGIAADKILAGYNATKKAIGNVDFGSDSLAGKKDTDKDKSDKDKSSAEKEQKDNKTRFNWLDQLINKIQRSLDLLSKRAEKYFEWAQKNAIVNKQIATNKKMIATQELAVAYYSNKASKSLKKVPKKYRSLVSGDFDAASIKNLVADIGSGKTKKLQEYLDWQNLVEKSQDALEEAYETERELIASKLENILEYFDKLNDYQQSIVDKMDAQMKADSIKGLATDINKLIKSYDANRKIYEQSGEREAKYASEYASNRGEIQSSYQNQLTGLREGYKDTTAYNRMMNKKSLKEWEMTALYYLGNNGVLAEDFESYLKQMQIWYKNSGSSKASKQKKAQDAWSEIEKMFARYNSQATDLTKAAQNQMVEADKNYQQQVNENAIATSEAYAEFWEQLHQILNAMSEAYDRQISKLNTVIDRYDTIATTLKEVDAATIKDFGVTDIFGTSSQRPDYLRGIVSTAKNQVAVWKKQYKLYEEMIDAANSKSIAKFQKILEKNDLDSESKTIVSDIVNQLANNMDWDASDWVTTWKEAMVTILKSISTAMQQAEEAADDIADSVIEATERIIDSLSALQQAYASRAALINDEWTVDKNGITDYGYAKISALNDEANVARQRAFRYNQEIAQLQSLSDSEKSTEEFQQKLNTTIKNYYDAIKDVHSVNNEIYNIAKKIAEKEVENISKLVENYKKALNAKKAYYDYDKQLKEKNKNIQSITAEIKALENVGDAASKARLKALQAELQEAQEDLDDTVFNHQIQVETDALDKLVQDLTEALQDTAETIQETFEKWSKTVKEAVAASAGVNTEQFIQDIIDFELNGAVTEEQLAKETADREKAEADARARIDELKNKIRDASRSKSSAKNNRDTASYQYEYLKGQEASFSVTDPNSMKQVLRTFKYNSKDQEKVEALLKKFNNAETKDEKKAIFEKLKAYSTSYIEALEKAGKNATRYSNEVDSLIEDIKTYEAEIEQLNNDIASMTLPTSTSSPSTSGSGTAPTGTGGTVSESGTLVSILTIHNDVLDLDKHLLDGFKGNKDVLSVLADPKKIANVTAETFNKYASNMQTTMKGLTGDVSTIAKNTTAINSQLTNIQRLIQAQSSSQQSANNALTSYLNGLKRVGRTVTYR